jgi:L-erythro-3,5-diaminohexanoate dehydrogenase
MESTLSEKQPHDLGLHRVLEPVGALPQAALRLDAKAAPYANEVVIDVETLNIDSASFHQILGDVGRDKDAVAARIKEIVAARGKMQNPVTGSGGMLLGTVKSVGDDYHSSAEGIVPGARVASLVSLTLTPLELEAIHEVHLDADQVDVTATAYLWPSSPIVAMPDDLPDRLALSALDVCGAPAQTQRLVQGAKRVLVLGLGKSGMLCAAAARDALGDEVEVYAFDLHDSNAIALKEAGIIDDYRTGDARSAVEVLEKTLEMTGGEPVELVVNTCNIGGVEMSAILPCADRGRVYFFNMATDFARAALGCEGVGRDVDLYIGNGYAAGHAALTLRMVRDFPVVRERIEALLGG